MTASDVFLGIIALSVLLMAILQLGAVIAAARYAKKIMSVTEDLQREIKPLAAKVHAIADEAQRATALAARQVDRVDHLVSDLSRRVQDTSATLQAALTGATRPVAKGSAMVAGLRAALVALLTTRETRFERDEEEDALFVG
ncbi:MAG: hypothetical protein M3R55_02800 [Acidobacteriota bacterium]|nr:hypothetical protein [Acidobacteriota bacterium]MDQ3170990.1 hypothetical protein [Acidobacteriota bacterium]